MVRIRTFSFLFFGGGNLWEEVTDQSVSKEISDRAYKNALFRAILNSYSDDKIAVRRDHWFTLERIQSMMRNIYRITKRDERRKNNIEPEP